MLVPLPFRGIKIRRQFVRDLQPLNPPHSRQNVDDLLGRHRSSVIGAIISDVASIDRYGLLAVGYLIL
jgi:hypothetical protein